MEYRARYFWYDANGKKKDSMTGWFDSQKEAEKNAIILKYKKDEASKANKAVQDSRTIKHVFDLFVNTLSDKAYRSTTDNTTSDVSRYQSARTVIDYYTPDDILNTKTRDISVNTFRKWLGFINESTSPKGKPLSGNTTRKYREILSLFNDFLAANGYYLDDELDVVVDNALARMKIKPRKAGRRERYCPSIMDMDTIFYHYVNAEFGSFSAFYWYTLFKVLFFSGMRSEEIIGLTWKHVHLDARQPYIDVVNAISEREPKENVYKRMAADVYHTKNNNSEREIPILRCYYDCIEVYRRKVKVEFGIDELGDYFVFPNINAKKKEDRVKDYQKQKNILRELDRVCSAEGLPKTDVQMLRHACATWLVTDVDHGGMGYEESRARDYFGHTSDAMLRDVYAKLNKKQRANRTSETFKEITSYHAMPSRDKLMENNKEINHTIRNPKAALTEKEFLTYYRIENEILYAIRTGKKEYHTNIVELVVVAQVVNNYLNNRNRDLNNEIKIVIDRDPVMDEISKRDAIEEDKLMAEDLK